MSVISAIFAATHACFSAATCLFSSSRAAFRAAAQACLRARSYPRRAARSSAGRYIRLVRSSSMALWTSVVKEGGQWWRAMSACVMEICNGSGPVSAAGFCGDCTSVSAGNCENEIGSLAAFRHRLRIFSLSFVDTGEASTITGSGVLEMPPLWLGSGCWATVMSRGPNGSSGDPLREGHLTSLMASSIMSLTASWRTSPERLENSSDVRLAHRRHSFSTASSRPGPSPCPWLGCSVVSNRCFLFPTRGAVNAVRHGALVLYVCTTYVFSWE